MSNFHLVSTRTTLASAALLSLSLLAGYESTASNEPANADLAATDNGPGVVVADTFPTVSEHLASVGDRVHFELDRYDLGAEALSTLQQQAALLQSYPEVAVTIQGHADERGTREYNLALGERRADSVRNHLIALGIPSERISVISYGKERPECAGADDMLVAEPARRDGREPVGIFGNRDRKKPTRSLVPNSTPVQLEAQGPLWHVPLTDLWRNR